jgi:hypothetical protein
MTQRGINLFAVALLVVGGAGLAIWATRPKADDDAPSAPSAPAKHEPRVHPAPFDAYARASPGDWAAYRIDNGLPTGHLETTVVRAITAADPDRVQRTDRGRVDGATDVDVHVEDFPRTGLTLERLTGLDRGGWTISDLAVGVEAHTVGGRSFRATKISFASADPMFPRKRTHTDLWISDEVPAGGVIASHEVQTLDASRFEFTEELVGFGDDGGTRWGDRPAGL